MMHHHVLHNLKASQNIWRYLSPEKFALLVSRRELWFTRADLLGDDHEGSLPDFVIANRNQKFKETAVRQKLERGSKAQLKDAFVSCWSMQAPKSLLMWKLYTPNAKGFAIETTINQLATCFVSKSNDLFDRYDHRIEKVRYLDYSSSPPPSNTLSPRVFNRFKHKRKGYTYEREIRAIIFSRQTVEDPRIGIGLSVDLQELISKVYVSHRNGFELFAEDLLREAGIKKEVSFPSFVHNPKY